MQTCYLILESFFNGKDGFNDLASATIVLSVDPSLLYIIGDPVDPTIVRKKLADQFQKKIWANKLTLRKRLFALNLREGNPVESHIKIMTETFEELCYRWYYRRTPGFISHSQPAWFIQYGGNSIRS